MMKTMKSVTLKRIVAIILMLTLICPVFINSTAGAKTSKYTIYKGRTETIKVSGLSKTAKVTWKLGSKKIAKIVKKGSDGDDKYATVKGLKAGTTTLKAVCRDGGKKSTLKYSIKVKNDAKKPTDKKAGSLAPVKPETPASNEMSSSGIQADDSSSVTAEATPTRTPGNPDAKPEQPAEPTPTHKLCALPTPRLSVTTSVPADPVINNMAYVDLSDESTMHIFGGASIRHNEDKTITLFLNDPYDGVSFFLPKIVRDDYKDFKYVTIEYQSSASLCDALYDGCSVYEREWEEGILLPTVIFEKENLDNRIIASDNWKQLAFRAEDGFKDDCVKGIKIFSNTERNVTITIKNIVFSTTGGATLAPTPEPEYTWLDFNLDQNEITTSTTSISGTLRFAEYESRISVVVNDEVIAEKEFPPDYEGKFVIPTDFSGINAKARVVIHRSYTGDNRDTLKICDSYQTFVIE